MKKLWVFVFIGVWLLVSASYPGRLPGADWERLESAGVHGQLSFDRESIEWLGYDLVNVQVKYRYVYRYRDEGYAYSVSSLKIDCSGKKLASVRIEDYDREGSLMSSVASPAEPWYPLFPGSPYEPLFGAVCLGSYPLHTEKR